MLSCPQEVRLNDTLSPSSLDGEVIGGENTESEYIDESDHYDHQDNSSILSDVEVSSLIQSNGQPAEIEEEGEGLAHRRKMVKSRDRRTSKQVTERKRRDRINALLETIRTLILRLLHRKPRHHRKMEKADLLELVVSFLTRQLRNSLRVTFSTDTSSGNGTLTCNRCLAAQSNIPLINTSSPMRTLSSNDSIPMSPASTNDLGRTFIPVAMTDYPPGLFPWSLDPHKKPNAARPPDRVLCSGFNEMQAAFVSDHQDICRTQCPIRQILRPVENSRTEDLSALVPNDWHNMYFPAWESGTKETIQLATVLNTSQPVNNGTSSNQTPHSRWVTGRSSQEAFRTDTLSNTDCPGNNLWRPYV